MFIKILTGALALIFMAAVTPARAAASFQDEVDRPGIEVFQPALVDVAPERVYAPTGFDDNDNAQIVLDGSLPDTCYKLGPTSFKIDAKTRQIFVRQQAYYYPGGWCAQVRINYVQTIDLGILPAGQYDVYVEQSDGTAKASASLPVALSTTSSPDDFLYAPLSSAHLEHSPGKLGDSERLGYYTLVLTGTFSSSCMRFKQVKVNVRPGNILEVLPIVEIERGNCAQVTTDFSIGVSLKEIPHGRYLIHVRSLNGQSINRIADL